MKWLLVGTGEEEGCVPVVDQPLVGHISDVVVLTWTLVEEAALLEPVPREMVEDVETCPVPDVVLLQ